AVQRATAALTFRRNSHRRERPWAGGASGRRLPFLPSHSRRVGIDVIEDHVDNDAGYRDIKPDRQRPSRDALMPLETSMKRAPCGNRNKRRHGGGENDVANQKRVVKRPRPIGAPKDKDRRREMVNQVTDQKERRDNKRGDHESLVDIAPAQTN